MIGRIPVLDVRPAVDCGARPAKAVVDEVFEISATVFREDTTPWPRTSYCAIPAGGCARPYR